MSVDLDPRVVTLPTGRSVGYRRFGEGPPVVLLHASPRSSLAVLPLGLRLADRATVFAFDSPGFGWSDPLPLARPDAADFADALIEAFDALGIAHAPIYGSHTGAAIAVVAALRHPGRVPALTLDGYAIFTPAAQAEYLANYLAPIQPAWDGTHLAFLWSRVRDQFTVFPWYLNGDAARMQRPRPSLDVMQGVIVDFLAAGDHYRAGYAAAFRFDGAAAVQRLTVPTTIMCRSDDALFSHLDALPDLPDCVSVRRLGTDDGLWAQAVHEALAPRAEPVEAESVLGEAVPARIGSQAAGLDIVRVPGGCVGITRYAGPAAAGRPLVLLPGIPGSARGEAGLARALAAARPVIVVDLPGFGASSLRGDPDAAGIAEAIRVALDQRGVGACDVVGLRESAALACILRRSMAAGLVLVDPVADTARASLVHHMTDVSPRREGGHLLAAWHQLCDTGLWRPWFVSDPAHAIPNGTDPDVPRMHAILTDWMRGGTQGRATLAAALAAPLDALALRAGAALLLQPGHPWSALHAAWAAGRLPVCEVADDRHARAAAILGLLEGLS
ncbi:MAG: alpha/beta fold hydrolase [Acetobacteraceae bacterium]